MADKKSLKCTFCPTVVEGVGDDAVKVTCSKCVNKSMNGFIDTGREFDEEDED